MKRIVLGAVVLTGLAAWRGSYSTCGVLCRTFGRRRCRRRLAAVHRTGVLARWAAFSAKHLTSMSMPMWSASPAAPGNERRAFLWEAGPRHDGPWLAGWRVHHCYGHQRPARGRRVGREPPGFVHLPGMALEEPGPRDGGPRDVGRWSRPLPTPSTIVGRWSDPVNPARTCRLSCGVQEAGCRAWAPWVASSAKRST